MNARNGIAVDPVWWAALQAEAESGKTDHHTIDAALMLVQCRLGEGCPLDDPALQRFLAGMVDATRGRSPDLLLAYGDFALNVMQDYDLAERLHKAAVAAATRSPRFRVSLATFLLRMGKLDEAQAELEEADRLDVLGTEAERRELVRRSVIAARKQ